MNVAEMIDERLVSFSYEASTKDDVLNGLGQMMFKAGKVDDPDLYIKGLYQRETEFTTGIGHGFAIPHCKSNCVKEAAFTLVKLNHPVEWNSMDTKPVDYVIMLAAPDTSDNVHLKMLSKLAVNLMDEVFREGIRSAKNIAEIRTAFALKETDES